MSTMEMDPVFTAALREALVATVRNSPRARRRWRWRTGTGLFVGLSVVAGGVAVASGVFSPPGAPVDTLLGNAIAATRTGSSDKLTSVHRPNRLPTFHSTLTCLYCRHLHLSQRLP